MPEMVNRLSAHTVIVDEVGEDAVSGLQSQLVCHRLGDQNLVVTCFVVKLQDASSTMFWWMNVESNSGPTPLNPTPKEVVVGLKDTLFHGKSLHVFHARCFLR